MRFPIVLAATSALFIATTAQAAVVDFDTFDGVTPIVDYASFNNLGGGEFAALGISAITATNPNRPLALFDTDCKQTNPGKCAGGDTDLATGVFGTPAQGLVLVVNDGTAGNPSDSTAGSRVTFDFAKSTRVDYITILDIDSGEQFGRLKDDKALAANFNALAFLGFDKSKIMVDIISSGRTAAQGNRNDNSLVKFTFLEDIFVDRFTIDLARGTSVGIAEIGLSPIPVPASLPLLAGALGLGAWVVRRRKA